MKKVKKTIDIKEAAVGLTDRQGPVERQRIGRTASITLGRNHSDSRQLAQNTGKRGQSRRKVTVIITQKNVH